MSRELHDPLIDLDRALDLEPSPGFAAGVRRRVEEKRAAPAWRWRFAIPAIVAIGLVSWLVVPSQEYRRIGRAAPAVAERVEAPAMARVLEAAPVPVVRPHPIKAPALRRASAPDPHPREPEVLVSPDQRLALDQLRTALADGRLDASVLPANLVEAPAQIAPAPTEPTDALGGGRADTDVLPRLEAPRHFVGRVVRTEF